MATYDQIFDVEGQCEPVIKQLLIANGLNAFRQNDNDKVKNPRIEVMIGLGAATGHRHPVSVDGVVVKSWLDAWNATLGFQIITTRTNDAGEHARWRSKIRYLMQYASDSLSAGMPFHVFTKIVEQSTLPSIQGDNDEDISQVHFSCLISVRPEVWPT